MGQAGEYIEGNFGGQFREHVDARQFHLGLRRVKETRLYHGCSFRVQQSKG